MYRDSFEKMVNRRHVLKDLESFFIAEEASLRMADLGANYIKLARHYCIMCDKNHSSLVIKVNGKVGSYHYCRERGEVTKI